eukprot:CAMPEP_0184989974 /NCGR_PEP_ID=MMETSP1098-20130426/30597_1 /TAXON_ID=89044 /ORGANISM="Spumella elongata, Strain CCAP 955/1" /LENGTH=109 /DNA_ID=CAMNT_0027515089 /DNA_START=30 /DNA_END=359 /DNA_ORIENTATION=-
MMHFRANLLSKAKTFQRRHAGGFLKKNIYVEENAGLREISYKTWTLSASNILSIMLVTVIPSYFVYELIIAEAVNKDTHVGRKEEYGILFSMKEIMAGTAREGMETKEN